jgi:DNA-binding transcriptional LysR family regulator
MSPELRHLRYFVAVAEELNFTRAAARLHIAQPSLSAQIQELERQVGCQLLRRSTRKVELSPVGQTFLEHAMRVLAVHDELVAAVQAAIDRTPRGEVHLAVGADAEPYVIERLVAFGTEHDEIKLTMTPGMDAPMIDLLAGGHLDAAVLWTGTGGDDNRLCRSPIGDVPSLVALRADDPLAGLDEIPIAALADRPLIMFQRAIAPGIWDVLVRHLRPAPSSAPIYEIASASGSQQPMLRAVADGLGAAPTTPAHAAALALHDIVVRPTVPPLQVGLELVMPARPSHAAQVLAAFLADDTVAARDNGNLRPPSCAISATSWPSPRN